MVNSPSMEVRSSDPRLHDLQLLVGPPSLLSASPPNGFEINKPSGGLNRAFTVSENISKFYDNLQNLKQVILSYTEVKGVVSRNSAKLGNYEMPIELRTRITS